MRRLVPETDLGAWMDPTGRLVLVERVLPEAWAGRPLDGLVIESRAKVVAVIRAGEPRLDTAGLIGQEGDTLHLVVTRDALGELEQLLAGKVPLPADNEAAGRP